MSLLSSEWLQRLGPEVRPFERTQFSRSVEEGEDIIFTEGILRVSDKNDINPVLLTVEDIQQNRPIEGKYLWVIDREGLKLILESTPNPNAGRKVVCHTNITGGAPALQGGELWFGDDSRIYLNYKSGRYGAKIGAAGATHRAAVLDFFRSINFNPVELTDPFQ